MPRSSSCGPRTSSSILCNSACWGWEISSFLVNYLFPPLSPHTLYSQLIPFLFTGIFVALMLRFDAHRARGRKDFKKPYFTFTFGGYLLGMVTTIAVMHFFQAAQVCSYFLFILLINLSDDVLYLSTNSLLCCTWCLSASGLLCSWLPCWAR